MRLSKAEALTWCLVLICSLVLSSFSASAQETHIFEYTGSYQYYTEGYFLIEVENFGYQVNADITVNYIYNCEPEPEAKSTTVNVEHSEIGRIWIIVQAHAPSVPELCFGDPVLDNVEIELISATLIPQQAPNAPPTASIVGADPSEGEVPLTIDFLGAGEDDNGIVRWEWIFGDGQNLEGDDEAIAATHTYSEPGPYLVFLKVWDEWGAVGYDFVMIKAYVQKPAIAGDIDVTGIAHTHVNLQFGASALFEGQEDYIEGYIWDFGDGNASTGMYANNTYLESGTFTATLTLRYYDGTSKTLSKELEIAPNEPPTPAFDIIGLYRAGYSLSFDASSTTDPEGDALSYSWDFGDGTYGSGMTTSNSFTVAGTYSVTLSVSDGVNNASLSKDIDLELNHEPVASFTTSGELKKGKEITFDASQSSDEDEDQLDYYWDFGDGDSAEGKMMAHIYDDTDTYSVMLTVTDQMSNGTHMEYVTIKEDGSYIYYIIPLLIIGLGLLIYYLKRGPGKEFRDLDLVKKGY